MIAVPIGAATATAVSTPVTPVVIRFGRLGDTILLQPLMRKLQQRYGKPCRVLALGGWPSVLFSAQPEVDGFIPLRSQHGSLLFSPARWRAALALRQLRDCPFYVCEPELRARTKVRPMLKLAGVRPENCQFIEDTPVLQNEHWIDWLMRFGDRTPPAFRSAYGASSDEAPFTVDNTLLEKGPRKTGSAPQLQASADERVDRDEWLRQQGMLGRPLVLLQPANKRTIRWNGVRRADDDDKSWPAKRWGALARAIAYRLPEAQILFCGSAAEAGYIRSLLAATDTGSLRIDTAVLPLGRLKALLEIAHSMISVDTGPAHLAAAMGCPLVVLFGSRWPSMWAPRSGHGSPVSVIGGLPEVTRIDEIDTSQVVSAWRMLPPRRALGAPVAVSRETPADASTDLPRSR